MVNRALEIAILKILNRVPTGLREKTLQSEVEIAMDRPTLTSEEFLDSLISLEDRALVDKWVNLIGDTVWGITQMGGDALKGL